MFTYHSSIYYPKIHHQHESQDNLTYFCRSGGAYSVIKYRYENQMKIGTYTAVKNKLSAL
jgi:hypothetical protein